MAEGTAEQLTAQKVGKPPAYLTAGEGGDAPPGSPRLLAVVLRHWLVYSTTLLANSLRPSSSRRCS